LRSLIAYADFLSMAAIALTRSLGIVNGYSRKVSFTVSTTATIGCCFLIWIISFIIISPTIFQLQLGNFSFGFYGWNNGKCEGVDCNLTGISGSSVVYMYGVFIPLIIIYISYIFLGIFVSREINDPTFVSREINDPTRIQMTLLTLSVAYAAFIVPILPVQLGGLLDPFHAMIFYSWYWWMYAINVVIYVTISKDFREVYKLFFKDVYKATVSPVKARVMKMLGRSGSWQLDTELKDLGAASQVA
jgi:hypothetical protein